MKTTLDLPDDLVKELKLRSVHEGRKLKDVAAAVLRRGLDASPLSSDVQKSLIETLTVPDMPDWFYEREFPMPDRKETKHRAFRFEPDTD
jgi:plasmid stability protein